METETIAHLLSQQSGVLSRRQVLAAEGSPADVERLLRRREWVRMLPGVFLNHTGEPTWLQRAWAGVLFYRPAALALNSALRAGAGPSWRRYDDRGVIEIAVDEDRNVARIEGYRPRRLVRFGERVQLTASPPRMRLEEAAIEVAARKDTEFGAIEVLSDLCQSRRTTARRLLSAVEGRARLPRRVWLMALLGDLEAGSCSVLEHGCLARAERAHGLPRPARQPSAASDRGPLYRDVDYEEFGLIVELDGRLFHDSAGQRDRDLDRDLDAAVDGRRTVRLGWGQVYDRSCRTAAKVWVLLQQRGWNGEFRTCGPTCPGV